MKPSRRLIVLCFGMLALQALACRYSVRDTGFVELGEELFQVILSGSGEPARTENFKRAAEKVFQDSNVEFVHRESSQTGATLVIRDTQGRESELILGGTLPDGNDKAKALLESMVTSPFRSELQQAALKSLGVVLMVDGTSDSSNRDAEKLILAAIQKVMDRMPSMPKPVNIPPALIRVPVSRQSSEKVVLWGLGLSPGPSTEPRVAVLFGRGRRVGTILEGPMITRTAIQERLMILGQDCECDLDRAWMKGPSMPARWDADSQREAARALGFDPENPLIRTEISRIVHRGPGTGNSKRITRPQTALGYTETAVEDLEPAPVDDAPSSAAATPDAKGIKPPSPAPEAQVHPDSSANPLRGILGAGIVLAAIGVWWWYKIGRDQG